MSKTVFKVPLSVGSQMFIFSHKQPFNIFMPIFFRDFMKLDGITS